jgi:hypothetical protein
MNLSSTSPQTLAPRLAPLDAQGRLVWHAVIDVVDRQAVLVRGYRL